MRSVSSFWALANVLTMMPGAGSGPGGLHSTAPRVDVGGEWPEGDLPEQMGGAFKVLMPSKTEEKSQMIAGMKSKMWIAEYHDGVRVRMTEQGQDIVLRGAAVMVLSGQLGVS